MAVHIDSARGLISLDSSSSMSNTVHFLQEYMQEEIARLHASEICVFSMGVSHDHHDAPKWRSKSIPPASKGFFGLLGRQSGRPYYFRVVCTGPSSYDVALYSISSLFSHQTSVSFKSTPFFPKEMMHSIYSCKVPVFFTILSTDPEIHTYSLEEVLRLEYQDGILREMPVCKYTPPYMSISIMIQVILQYLKGIGYNGTPLVQRGTDIATIVIETHKFRENQATIWSEDALLHFHLKRTGNEGSIGIRYTASDSLVEATCASIKEVPDIEEAVFSLIFERA